MAWLDRRGDSFRVVFQVGGHTFKRSLGTADQREASGKVAAIERRIAIVERGELVVPNGVDLPAFLVDDGQAYSLCCIATSNNAQKRAHNEVLPAAPSRN